MGLFSSVSKTLFGDAPESKVHSKKTRTKEQTAAINGLLKAMGVSFNESKGKNYGKPTFDLEDIYENVPEFSGELSVGAGDILQGLFDDAGSEDFDPFGGSRSYLENIVNADPEDFQDYFRSAVAQPARDDFWNEDIPGLQAAFRAVNPFDSGNADSLGRAFEDFNDTLVSTQERFAFETSESQRDRALTAAVELAQLDGLETDLLLQLGTAQTDLEQDALDRELALFLDLEDRRSRRIQEMIALSGIQTQENIGTVTGGSSGLLSGVASGFATGYGSTF